MNTSSLLMPALLAALLVLAAAWRCVAAWRGLKARLADAVHHAAQAAQAAEQARTELAVYKRAIEQHALVSVANTSGIIVEVNERMAQVSGYAQEEMIGMDHRTLDSEPADREAMRKLRATLTAGEIWRGELSSRTKQGELYWVDSAIVPLRDANGATTRYLRVGVDVTMRKRGEAELARQATHDGLTGLANRALLRDRMQQALEVCKRNGEMAAALFIDMNRFKAVNDGLGHDVGDQLLVAVALRLRAAVRAEDTVARVGGDEFVVFMPRMPDAGGAQQLAQKLEQLMSEPFGLAGHKLQVGASVGVGVFPTDGTSVDDVLKASDTQMYRAKGATGR